MNSLSTPRNNAYRIPTHNNSLSFHKLQSSFFAHFMCFEVPALVPPGNLANGSKTGPNDDDNDNDDDLGIMDIDDNDGKTGNLSSFLNSYFSIWEIVYRSCNFVGKRSADLEALNESLRDLLDGIQVLTIQRSNFEI